MAKKVPWWLSWWAVLSVCGLGLLLVVALGLAGGGANLGLVGPDLAAVRAYLRENLNYLDTGTWEELRWWPNRDVPDIKGTSVWKPYQGVCRLKFRAPGLPFQSRQSRVQDIVFYVKDGKAKPIPCPGYRHEREFWQSRIWKELFPTDCDEDD